MGLDATASKASRRTGIRTRAAPASPRPATEPWRISWAIGSEKYEGYAIGDKEVLSVMFTSSGRSGVALYVSDENGGYNGMWAFRGDTRISKEKLRPR